MAGLAREGGLRRRAPVYREPMRPLSELVAAAGNRASTTALRLRTAPSLARLAVRASRTYHVPLTAVARRLVRLRRRGFRLCPYFVSEIGILGLLDPALPESRSREIVAATRVRPLELRLSPEPLSPVVDDKALFYTVCSLAGWPIAPVHAYFYRDYPGWTRTGATPATREQWARALDAVLPPAFVAKPNRGDMGLGVRAFRRDGAGFREGERRLADAAELHDALAAGGEAYVLAERVRNHELLAELAGVETLQSLRIVTLLENAREVSVLAASQKVAIEDTVVDHSRNGETGQGAAAVDLESGRLGPLILPRADGLGLLELDRHPRTGRRCTGLQLPDWEEALELVRRTALGLGMLRTVGWDLALTEDGPIVLEANTGWAPTNWIWPCAPLLERLRQAVAREDAPPAAAPRPAVPA